MTRRGPRPGGDTGQSTLEFAVVASAVLTLIFVVIGYAMFEHAQSVVEGAARAGAMAAAAQGASPAAGRDKANQYLDSVGSGLVEGRRVQASGDGENVTVRVDGTARTPVLRLSVHAMVVRRVERFRADTP